MSSDIHSVLVGETYRKASLVAKASGSAITSGTINYYLKCLTGTNAGKWWKDSTETWDASETANAMTHQADGCWTITLTSSPFADGVLYLEYAKESGDLHVAGEGQMVRGKAVVDDVNVSQINASATAASNMSTAALTMLAGTIDDTAFTPTTTEFESSITENNENQYVGRLVVFTSGTLIRQASLISAYSRSSGRGHFTVGALTESPANGVTLIIV